MTQQEILIKAFVYLTAAVIAVPLAKKLGLGSVLGYLIAGIAIGANGLGFLGDGSEDVLHFAEFGVVMMLFLIGLELKPSLLWELKAPILGLGGLQVSLVSMLFTVIAHYLGISWPESFALGMILALSSTAIVMQTLAEKGLTKTEGGKGSFAILLFQDIAVIPMFAILPLLATHKASAHGDGHGASLDSWMNHLPGWAEPAVIFGAIVGVMLAGHFVMKPLFRMIAATRLREIFTVAALFLVIGVALAMQAVGLSPALGAFLAGVVLAESEYRTELEMVIEPFKGIFLGLFFISVGAAMDFSLLAEDPIKILTYLCSFVLLKFIVLFFLGHLFRVPTSDKFLIGLSLCGGGEFAFVMFSFCVQNGVLDQQIADEFTLAVALSMALTPLLFVLKEKVIDRRLLNKNAPELPMDTIEESAPVIIAGYGRFGNVVGRMLQGFDIPTIVLEHSAGRIDALRKLGLKAYYGDASRLDLLQAAGAAKAKLMIITLDDQKKTLEIVQLVNKYFPNLKVLVRSSGRTMSWELMKFDIEHIYRETLDTSLAMAVDALRFSGIRAYEAKRAAHEFKIHDEKSVREVFKVSGSQKAMFSRAKEMIREVESALKEDQNNFDDEEESWDSTVAQDKFKDIVKKMDLEGME